MSNHEADDPMLALRRARRAWERSQPQLFLDFGGLESGEVKRADCSSPLRSAAASPVSNPPNPGEELDGASEQPGRRVRL